MYEELPSFGGGWNIVIVRRNLRPKTKAYDESKWKALLCFGP